MYALVTGASRGIGKSITEKLLDSEAKVIGTTRLSEFPNPFRDHPNFEGLHVDLSDPEGLTSTLKPVFARKEAPGVLINNAGMFDDADVTSDDEEWLQNWDRTLQVNLRAPALLSKWALNRW